VKLVAVHPETKKSYLFTNEKFEWYEPIQEPHFIADELKLAESTKENLPVSILTNVL
jgi:hypothetical protein